MSGGKTYQVTQVDPLNPHTKGMVYQVSVVGGFTQIKEMPEASADNVGIIYQYTGETDSNFTHGFFYESQALGTTPETYGWVAINVQQGGATNSATTDLSNLTDTGKNIANWSTNVSNCITEIPQDISLTLSNGTLTLKTGSKVYFPNGGVTYTPYTFAADRNVTQTSNGTYLVGIGNNSKNIALRVIQNAVSGATDSMGGQGYHWWYDTTNNVINSYSSDASTPNDTISLPIAIITVSGGAISSIDQIFNGFGYIGSTVFALPGVKGLVPDGRNADGTLKSRSWACSSVITRTFESNETFTTVIALEGTAFGRAATFNVEYNEKDNVLYLSSNKWNFTLVAQATLTNGVISNFTTVNTEHLLSYNDTDFIVHQAMPSSRYVNLTLGNTGTNYTMPADGYLGFGKNSGAADEYVTLRNETNNNMSATSSVSNSGIACRAFLPVSKGDSVKVVYTLSGTTDYFRFFYANGSK